MKQGGHQDASRPSVRPDATYLTGRTGRENLLTGGRNLGEEGSIKTKESLYL